MNKYFYLLFILLSVCCGKKNRITELKIPPVIHLTGEKVETILPRCYETGVLVDSFLVLKEKCTDTMFYLFSTNTDREIFRFGREGRGVCEFYYPFFLVNSFAYDSLIIYDSPAATLTKIDLAALVESRDIAKCANSEHLYRNLNFMYNFNKVDSAFIGTFIEKDEGLFSFCNRNNGEIKNTDYVPYYFYEKGRKDAYCHHVLVSEKDNSIIVPFKYMNLINCYDLDGNLKVTYALDWIKEEINTQIRVDEHTTVTFYRTYATRNRCYLVWDGHKIEEELRKYPAKIVVMNWQGELEKVYQLDNFADFIIPDEKQRMIYVGVYNAGLEFVEIYKYPML